MELILHRTYHAKGTNGTLYLNGKKICHTIELPWLNNEPRVSCIPEGTYALLKRETTERGDHLLVADVPGRSLILIHAANNALKELMGCIAPVTLLTGAGLGDQSKAALLSLEVLVFEALDRNEDVTLTITQKPSLINITNA